MNQLLRTVFVTLLLGAVFSSCQEEVVEITNPPSDQVVSASSNVADLIQKTSTKDGSVDNIIDHNSCITVVLPVTVFIDGQEFIVESLDQLGELEDLLEEGDDDDLEINFPITISFPDYTELIINSEDELDDLEDDCSESDDDIECIDFTYPITLSVYDPSTQQSDIITISNDEQFYIFMDNLDEDEIFSFSFPLTVILWNGQEIQVNNNDDLEDLLEDAIDDCDEDDDNDFDDDDVDDSNLIAVLTAGEWNITKVIEEGQDRSDLFENATLTFMENGEVVYDDGELEVTGNWSTNGNDGILRLEVEFDTDDDSIEDLLDLIEQNWDVLSFNAQLIDLKDESDLMTLTK